MCSSLPWLICQSQIFIFDYSHNNDLLSLLAWNSSSIVLGADNSSTHAGPLETKATQLESLCAYCAN